ncbi:MAG TPA: RHS repeat-associated core domain-containing protein [Paludibacter sp.]|nr:RHS repeat-associated core domain-containing protein [Paludibacter sp.]
MTNSLGVAEKTSYDQLYQGANYTPGTTATFPNTDFQGPLWITTQTSDMYNKQLISNTTYNYTGAIMHEQGLGLRGFTSTKVTDMMTNKVTTTTFDPYKMGVVIGQSSDNTESSFKYNFTDYDSSTGGNKKMKLLLTNKIVTDKLKGNTVTVSYPLANYDSYGNPGREITDFGDGITSTVVNNFENRIGTVNLIGLLTNKVTTNVRDGKSFNQTEGYEYDTNNRLHYVRKYIGSKMLTETEYKYTAYGTVSNETMHNIPTNDYLTTSYTYDNDQYLLKTKTDPQGLVTTYTNNLSNRLLVGITDYLGKTVTYGYDNWRRKNYELRPDGTTTNIIWAWNPDSSQKGIIMETQASLGQPATMLYTDALGREARKAIIGFDGTLVFVDKAYDNFGRLASTSAPYKSGSGALLTTYAYDEYNRAKTIVQPSGSTTSYSYSGNSVTENKDGVSVTKTTDATGKLVSSQDAGGTITYAYRPDGQPDNVNAAGVVTSFEYTDDYNRQTKLIDPSAGTIGTIYDDANHMVTQTWNSGKQIKTVSNKFGQPVSKVTPDFTTTYGYENGKLKTVNTNNGSSKSFNYDGFGRLSGFDDTFNGKELYQQYTYELGRLKNVTYYCANYFSVNYKYNSSGYLYRLEDGSGNRLREINSVDATGQETSVLLGNGLTTTKNYTPEGLETNVTTSNNVQNMSFDFNRITGTLNSRTDNVHGLSESFTYDGLYRLKNYGSRVVGYDSNGNILSKTDAGGYIYNRNKPYTLDSIINANADLTSQLNVDYTVMSRPTSIRNTTGLTATFGYNDDYNRTYMQVKQDGTETMSKYYLGGGRYEIETAGGVEKQRLYLDGSPYTASLLVEKVGGNSPQLYFLHRDYLGSITQVTDNNGNLAAEYSYDAWGRMRNPANWNVYSTTAQPTPMFGRGYTGHEHLNQFGIINMNARLYDPLLARFLAPDPQVSSPEASNGYNRYMYALDNPMMYTDINGEEGGLWWGGNNNNYPAGPYRPDYNPNPGWGTGQSFYNPYGGPDSGYQGSSYSGYQGGYYGGGGSGELAFLGPLIYSWLNSQNGSNRRPQMKLSGDPTTHSYIKGSPAPAPAGLGSPRVSSGGGNRRGNMSSSGGSLFNGEIKPFQPNIFERISTSGFGKGIIGKVLYGIADDLWMTACCFTIGHERAFHLSGAYAISDETVTSGINTMTNFVPIGSYGKFASIGEKTLNAGQFNALMKGSGITAATNAGIELRLYNFTVRESNNISSFWNYFGTTSTISTYLFTSK